MGRKKTTAKHHSEKNGHATAAAAVPDGPRESRREHKDMTRQRINGRFLFISLGIVVVSGLSLHLLHGVQVERNSVSLKERAEAAEEEGEYGKAVGLLSQYLTFRDDDHDALLHLVRLRDGLATSGQALANVYLGYEEVLRRAPSRPDEAEIRQDAIAVAMTIAAASAPSDAAAAGQYYNLALGHLDVLLGEDFRDKHQDQVPELIYHRGICHRGLGRVDKAFRAYLEAIGLLEDELDKSELHKARPRFYLALAQLVAESSRDLPKTETGAPAGLENEGRALAERILLLVSKIDPTITSPDPLDDQASAAKQISGSNPNKISPNEAADQILRWLVEPAEERAKKSEKQATKETNKELTHVYVARAQYRYSRLRLKEARQDVDRALDYDPQSVDTLLFSARLAVDQARNSRLRGPVAPYSTYIATGRQAALRGQKIAPKDPRFYRLEAMIEEEAREGVRWLPAIAERPGRAANVAGLTNPHSQAQWKQYQAVETALRQGLTVVGEAIEKARKQKPERLRLRIQDPHPESDLLELSNLEYQMTWSLADTLISQQDLLAAESPKIATAQSEALTEVQKHLEFLVKARASHGVVDFLRARLLILKKEWNDAAWLLEQTWTRLAGESYVENRFDLNNRLHRLLDQCYGQMGNPDRQLQVALQARDKNPNWLPTVLRVPELYRQANRPSDALREYERIRKLPGASVKIAALQLQRELRERVKDRNFKPILETLESENVDAMEKPHALAILKSEVLFWQADQLEEGGQTAEAQQKYQDASAELDEALGKWPSEPELWAASARMELKAPVPLTRTTTERIEDTKAILQRAKAEIGDHLALRLAEVEAAMYLPLDEARQKLEDLESSQFSVSDRSRLLNVLAQASLSLSTPEPAEREANQKRALAWLKQAAELQPNEVALQIEWAELARTLSETDSIRTAIDRVTAVEGPGGPNGNYLKALEIFAKAKDISKLTSENQNRVRKLLVQAQKDRPFWAVLERTLGDLEWAAKREADAVKHYLLAYNLGDRSRASLLMFSRIAKYYLDNQRPSDAKAFLERVALDTPNLVTGELRLDQIQAEALSSNNPDGLIFLSQWRQSQGETGEAALDPLKKASEIAPTTPGTWWALVDYYVRVNDLKQAKQTIVDAEQKFQEADKDTTKAPLNRRPRHRLPLTLAGCHERLGDRAEAEDNYTMAYDVAKANNEDLSDVQLARAKFYARTTAEDPKKRQQDFKTAHDLVSEIISSRAGLDTKRGARRFKAILLSSTGRYEDTEKALQLIADNQDNDSVEDLLTKVRILGVRNRYRDRLELIKTIEQLENRGFPSAELKLLLARLYQQADDWQNAEKHYLELLRQNGKNPVVPALYINGLIGQGQLKDAQKRLEEFKLQQAGSFTVFVLEATLEHAKGNISGAVRLILDGVQNLEEADSPNQAVKDLFLAGKLDEAVDYLEKQSQETNKRDALPAIREVRQLLAQGRSDQAKDLLERQIDTSQLEILQFKAAAKMVDGWGELTEAESILRTMLERSDRPEDVLLLVSNVARQGRIDEALDLCEKAWETCDVNRVGGMCVGILRTNNASAAQMARAEKQLLTAIEKHPENHNLMIPLADLRDFQGRYDDAEQVYREILKKDGGNLTALNNLAWLVGMREKDLLLASKSIEIAVGHAETLIGPVPELLDTRAVIYLKLRKNRDALKDLEQAINVSKEATPLMYFHLTQAQLAVGDQAAAKKSFEKARSLKAEDFHPLERETFERVSQAFATP